MAEQKPGIESHCTSLCLFYTHIYMLGLASEASDPVFNMVQWNPNGNGAVIRMPLSNGSTFLLRAGRAMGGGRVIRMFQMWCWRWAGGQSTATGFGYEYNIGVRLLERLCEARPCRDGNIFVWCATPKIRWCLIWTTALAGISEGIFFCCGIKVELKRTIFCTDLVLLTFIFGIFLKDWQNSYF